MTFDGKCEEINNCLITPPVCSPYAVCTKTGPGTNLCKCKDGYVGDGKACNEINACETGPCGLDALCTKTGPGKFSCSCREGFKGDGFICTETNPCDNSPCAEHAFCTHTGPAAFTCKCYPGYEGNGQTLCHESDGCDSSPCDAHAKCTPTGAGAYSCNCYDGWMGDGFNCAEVLGSGPDFTPRPPRAVPVNPKDFDSDSRIADVDAEVQKLEDNPPAIVVPS